MQRYRLDLEYDGTSFCGWQEQGDGRSIQEAVQLAVLAMTQEKVKVQSCGRTDSGVHAFKMPVHLDLQREWAPEKLRDGINYHLKPLPVVVVRACLTTDAFHARFSAIMRHYRYLILNRRARPGLDVNRVWHIAKRLDTEHMHEAAQALKGRHDFTSFRSTQCQAKSPLKTLDAITVRREGDLVCIDVSARSFLHHQVRNMVGTLYPVGVGLKEISFVEEALTQRDRRKAGVTAPASGLYFRYAEYKPNQPKD